MRPEMEKEIHPKGVVEVKLKHTKWQGRDNYTIIGREVWDCFNWTREQEREMNS